MRKKGRPEVHLDHFTMRLMMQQSNLNRADVKWRPAFCRPPHRTASPSNDLLVQGVVFVLARELCIAITHPMPGPAVPGASAGCARGGAASFPETALARLRLRTTSQSAVQARFRRDISPSFGSSTRRSSVYTRQADWTANAGFRELNRPTAQWHWPVSNVGTMPYGHASASTCNGRTRAASWQPH
jgi:hypothetical protein